MRFRRKLLKIYQMATSSVHTAQDGCQVLTGSHRVVWFQKMNDKF